MSQQRVSLSDEGKAHKRKDPDQAELEVDAANAEAGGPSTGSLHAGLPRAGAVRRQADERQ